MLVLETIEQTYKASTGSANLAAEMLQLNLDIISIQSHIALTLLLYAEANRDSIDDGDYAVYFEIYMNEVQDFIDNQFNSNITTSIPYIFEHR